MSSTLCFRRTPKSTDEFAHVKQPLKGIFARRYYDHDGSLGGGLMTLSETDLDWLRGVQAGFTSSDPSERKALDRIIEIIEAGDTVDMWFEC